MKMDWIFPSFFDNYLRLADRNGDCLKHLQANHLADRGELIGRVLKWVMV